MGRSSWRGCRRRSPRRWAGRCRSGCRSRTRTSSISRPKRPFVAERSVAERTAAEARVARIEAERRLSLGQRVGRLLEREAVFGYLMVAPAILYIVVLVGYPFVIALWFTVSDATVSQPIGPFTGLRNLQFVLDDDVFKRALQNTLVFTLSSQALQMVFGTLLAWLLTKGNPINSTHVIASYAFVTGILSGGLGRGATMSLFLFPVLLVAALLMLRNLKARTLD